MIALHRPRITATVLPAIIAWWCCAFFCITAAAQFVEPGEAESAGQESLSARSYPWYDADKDDSRTVDIQVHKEPTEEDLDPGNRNSDWIYDDTSTAKPATPPTMPGWLAGLLELLTWGILAIAVVAIAGLMIWGFMLATRSGPSGSMTKKKTLDRTTDVDRVEELPVNIAPKSDLLAEARRLFEAGDYAQAAVYLYSYKLMMLDRAQQIRLTRGKTNRQYLAEVAVPALRDILKPTMIMFEDAFFGKRDIPRQRFDSCWNRIEAFENLILSHQPS